MLFVLFALCLSTSLNAQLHKGHTDVWNEYAMSSSSDAKNAFFMSGKATNEIYIFSLHEMK